MKRIIDHIISQHTPEQIYIVGLDGMGGAGKSTVSEELRDALKERAIPVILLHTDDFIHPKAIRYNDSLPSWQCYYDLQWRYDYLHEILQLLRKGDRHTIPVELYDKENDCYRTEGIAAVPGAVVIVEGVFLQRKELAGVFDCMAYLDIPEDILLKRVLQRDSYIGDTAAIREKYETRYFPAEHHYVAEYTPAAHADFVLK